MASVDAATAGAGSRIADLPLESIDANSQRHLKVEPAFDDLRDDPGYAELAKRIYRE